MAKKDKMTALPLNESLEQNNTASVPAKVNEKSKDKNGKPKKKNFFVRIGRYFKEIYSELKKVTWATWKTVLSSTGIVLGVVGLFLICLLGIDSGLGALLKLITKSN